MPHQFADLDFCYLTTTGRVTARLHTIEIWFALDGATLYMLSGNGGDADWVKNLRRHPRVSVRLGDGVFHGYGRVVADPTADARARQLLIAKYQPPGSSELESWGRTALPVAVDLELVAT